MTNHYDDGSLDEWYKGERAFAAAAFTTHAVARALPLLQPHLPAEEYDAARKGLRQTAQWLTGRNDLFKTNHQSVGVAALAYAGAVLDEPAFTENARAKLASIVAAQTAEGWCPEVGHMDVGYSFLTVEFVAMAMDLWDDWSAVAPFVKTFDFACEWVHPDLTLGDEYGVCHNPYVSRIAPILLAPHSGKAAWLSAALAERSPGFKGFANTLGDELRFPRWAFQPLLAYDLSKRAKPPVAPVPLPLTDTASRPAIYRDAAMARFSAGDGSVVFAPCAGGLVRMLRESAPAVADVGYAIAFEPGRFATNQTYHRGIVWNDRADGGSVEGAISPVKKFMPSFLARVILRGACSTAVTSRLTRQAIDVVRKRKGSALNQSSANLSADSPWKLSRSLTVGEGVVTVRDTLRFDEPVAGSAIFLLADLTGRGNERLPLADRIADLPSSIATVTIEKTYTSNANGWGLASLRMVG